jgi:hypothetical protein
MFNNPWGQNILNSFRSIERSKPFYQICYSRLGVYSMGVQITKLEPAIYNTEFKQLDIRVAG